MHPRTTQPSASDNNHRLSSPAARRTRRATARLLAVPGATARPTVDSHSRSRPFAPTRTKSEFLASVGGLARAWGGWIREAADPTSTGGSVRIGGLAVGAAWSHESCLPKLRRVGV